MPKLSLNISFLENVHNEIGKFPYYISKYLFSWAIQRMYFGPQNEFESVTVNEVFITKARPFKYIENFTSKNWKFSDKNSDIFHISAQNVGTR